MVGLPGYINTKDAKTFYFLAPADLAKLCSKKWGGGIGCGSPTKFYLQADLEQAALLKHGQAGLDKKRAARAKREANKRKKEADAADAQRAFDNAKRSRIGGVTGSGGITDAECSAVNRKELAAMKKEVVRALKPFLTWNYLHQKNSPNGAWVTARIERVEQTMYCGLIGKPHDPQLRTLVKKGAWYQAKMSVKEFFDGEENRPRGKGGKYGSNTELAVDPECDVAIKFCPSTRTISIGAYISHIDSQGCY